MGQLQVNQLNIETYSAIIERINEADKKAGKKLPVSRETKMKLMQIRRDLPNIRAKEIFKEHKKSYAFANREREYYDMTRTEEERQIMIDKAKGFADEMKNIPIRAISEVYSISRTFMPIPNVTSLQLAFKEIQHKYYKSEYRIISELLGTSDDLTSREDATDAKNEAFEEMIKMGIYKRK